MKKNLLLFFCCVFASHLGATSFIAYDAPNGTVGYQIIAVLTVGDDFVVNSPVVVTKMGAFDSGSDGIFNQPVQVAIFNADTEAQVTPIIEFSTGDPGVLVGGNRFKTLSTPVVLPAGNYSIVAANYGDLNTYEPEGNNFYQGDGLWSFNDGGGLLFQNGKFRLKPDGNMAFPKYYVNVGQIGTPNPAYMAGTFEYQSVAMIPDFGTSISLFGLAFLFLRFLGKDISKKSNL